MATLVVDASAIAAILFGEPEGGAVAARLGDNTLLAPVLLEFELANICLKKIRRHPDRREPLLAAHGLLARFDIDWRDSAQAASLALAEQYALSAYDAAYLWLARELDAQLITLDARLAAAAST